MLQEKKAGNLDEVLVVISCFVNIILWLFMFFYFKKKFSSQEILENIRQEVDKLLIEISRETDRDLSLVEDKMKALKELIDTADQRIKTAKKEQKKQKKEEAAINKIQEMANTQEYVYEQPVFTVGDAVSRYKENVGSSYGVVEEKSQTKEIKQADDFSKQEKPVREKILELWKLGFEPERISEKLSVSLTEIRMVIDMFG